MKISQYKLFKRVFLPFYILWVAVSWYLPATILINVFFSYAAYTDPFEYGVFYQHFFIGTDGKVLQQQQPVATISSHANKMAAKTHEKPDLNSLLTVQKQASRCDRLIWFANVTRAQRQINLSRAEVYSGIVAGGDTITSFSLNYEHEFGVSKGKRPGCRRRVPQLLIR